MFRKIMVPVDLNHTDTLDKALAVAADLASRHDAPVAYVAVAPATPGPLGHTPEEKAARLADFAAKEAEAHGIAAEPHSVISHDPTADLDASLARAVDETGADLVVMASHVPGLSEYVWPSHGGRLAVHAKISVFVVRPD